MTVTRAPERGRVGPGQAAWLVFAMVLPPAILYLPSLNVVAVRSGMDGRLSMLVATGVAMLLLAPSWGLVVRYPRQTLPQLLEIEWGLIGRLLVGLYVVGLLIHGAFQARAFAMAISATILPRTPVLPIIFFQLAVAVFAARKGIEVIARINQVATPLMLLGLLALLLLATRDLQIERMPPAFVTPVPDILRGAVAPLAWFLEVALLAHVVFPSVQGVRRAALPCFVNMGLTGFLLAATLWVAQAVLGVQLARQSIVMVEKIAREVQPAAFFSRVEALYLASWQPAAVVEFAILIYGAALMGAQLFALRDYRSLVLPMGLFMGIGGSFLVPSIPEVIRFAAQVTPVYAALLGAVVPLFLFLFSLRRPAASDPASRGGV